MSPSWLRWHSLLGAVPLAGYLLLHLLGQLSSSSSGALQRAARAPDRSSLSLSLEIGLIYLPFVAHAGLGLWRMSRGEPSSSAQQAGNGAAWPLPWGRTLQRLSAFVLLIFLVCHVWQFEGRLWLGELRRADFVPELVASLSSTAFGGVPLVALGYLLGMAAASVHAAQGLYHACLGWGLVTPPRRERLAHACLLGGVLSFAAGTWLILQLATGSVL